MLRLTNKNRFEEEKKKKEQVNFILFPRDLKSKSHKNTANYFFFASLQGHQAIKHTKLKKNINNHPEGQQQKDEWGAV